MKRLFITGLMVLGMGAVASAQSNNTNDDDIYATPNTAQQQADKEAKMDKQRRMEQQGSDESRYSSSGRNYDSRDNNQTYQNEYSNGNNDGYRSYGDDYIDYDDDYYYSSHINRFYNPIIGMNYFSGYYNPFWYNRYWMDPYWGYNPWYSSGISVGIGFGFGGYGGWGFNSWYGFPAFYSAWDYPYYSSPFFGGWYGGLGYGWGGYGGYYGGGYGYRNVSYGPRYSLNGAHNGNIRPAYGGYRSGITPTPFNQGNIRPFRMANAGNGGNGNATTIGRPQMSNNGEQIRSNGDMRPQHRGFFGNVFGGNRAQSQGNIRQEMRPEGGRQMSAPSRSFSGGNGGGFRSSGGGFGGGSHGGGGGFGGGGHRR